MAETEKNATSGYIKPWCCMLYAGWAGAFRLSPKSDCQWTMWLSIQHESINHIDIDHIECDENCKYWHHGEKNVLEELSSLFGIKVVVLENLRVIQMLVMSPATTAAMVMWMVVMVMWMLRLFLRFSVTYFFRHFCLRFFIRMRWRATWVSTALSAHPKSHNRMNRVY